MFLIKAVYCVGSWAECAAWQSNTVHELEKTDVSESRLGYDP